MKNQPFPNHQSQSDSFWGLGKGTAAPAQPPPAGTSRAAKSPTRSPRLHHLRGRGAAALLLTAVFTACLSVAGPAAQANTPIESYATVPSTTQAGGHPDVEISFSLANRAVQHSQSPCNCEDAKDATVHFPPGFIGNPHATPQCTLAALHHRFLPRRLPGRDRRGFAQLYRWD